MVMSSEYAGQTSFFGTNTPLPLESGYAIVWGFGACFSVLTTVMVYLDKYANGTEHTSEFFNTAGRSVKTGLTASVIVSQWTWAATLLQSSNVAMELRRVWPFLVRQRCHDPGLALWHPGDRDQAPCSDCTHRLRDGVGEAMMPGKRGGGSSAGNSIHLIIRSLCTLGDLGQDFDY